MEYIEREAAIRALTLHDCDSARAKMAVCDIPSADVAPARHGRWENGFIDTGDGPMPERAYLCSQCGKAQWRKSRYCPNCGAKMIEG